MINQLYGAHRAVWMGIEVALRPIMKSILSAAGRGEREEWEIKHLCEFLPHGCALFRVNETIAELIHLTCFCAQATASGRTNN